ncbi:MAG: hypothetical protein ACR2QK_13165 [Acidimicrobiales bacterium]
MNFVGHIHLAALALPDRAEPADRADSGFEVDRLGFLIGSALPDIAAMGRFRLADRPTDQSIGAGVDLHHRTDDVFHRHPWFRHHSKAVADELDRAGLSRGAARACGHVGVELLLDGLLLDDEGDLRPSVQQAMSQLNRPRFELEAVVADERQEDWADHLQSVAGWTLPNDYRRPVAVAERLRRILSRRPRLAFGSEQIAVVGSTLARQQPDLESGVDELVDDLSASLAA